MKKFLVSFCLVALGLTAGLTVPRIFAQPGYPGAVQKWEQFCEAADRRNNAEKAVPAWNASMRTHGANGFQLVSVEVWGNFQYLCYRRPAQ